MDGSAFRNMNFGPIIWFAMFGLACAVLLALGAAGGLIWFFLTHSTGAAA